MAIPRDDVMRVAMALIGSTSSVIAVMYRLEIVHDVDEMLRELSGHCYRKDDGLWVASGDIFGITDEPLDG